MLYKAQKKTHKKLDLQYYKLVINYYYFYHNKFPINRVIHSPDVIDCAAENKVS